MSLDGFTLLETLVAIAVSGLVLLGSATTLATILDVERRGSARVDRAAAATNGERTLAEIIVNLRPTHDATPSLHGTSRSVAFRSRCPAAGPTASPCTVAIRLEKGTLAIDGGGVRLLSVPVPENARWLYLVHARSGGSWTDRWESVAPPLALGLALPADTIIFPIGISR